MDFKISDTNRGKKSLLHNGYSYRIDVVLKSDDISWRCTNKKCKGRLRTDSASTTLVLINKEHFHDSDKKKLERQQLTVQVKSKILLSLTPPRW